MRQVSVKSKEGKIGRKSKEYEVTGKTNEVRGSYKPVWSHSERYWPTPPHPRETWQSQVSGCDSRKWVVTVSSETPARGICLTWQSSKSLKFCKILWIFFMKIFIEHVIIMGIDNSLQVSGGPKPPPSRTFPSHQWRLPRISIYYPDLLGMLKKYLYKYQQYRQWLYDYTTKRSSWVCLEIGLHLQFARQFS